MAKGPGILKRLSAARKAFASGVGYEITVSSRTRRALSIISGLAAGADRHQDSHTLGRLREICRMHDRQSALFSGLLDRAVSNIFGASFDFIPATGDRDMNEVAKRYITRRMEARFADAAGERDLPEIAAASLRAVWNDGDILHAMRKDGSLATFEADQVVTPSGYSSEAGRRIVMGVELDDNNRHLGYRVKVRKTSNDTGMVRRDGGSERIPKRFALFSAYRKRFGQTRGVPFLAAALGIFDRTSNYLDYEQLAAEGNAMLGFKIKKEPSGVDLDGVEDNEYASSDTFEKIQKMEPFEVFDLAPGEDVDMIGSQRPGSNFEPYIITCCRIIGVAVGFPLELMLLDFSRTNYSSARASLGEGRRMFRMWQRFSGRTLCEPWYRWQIARGIATGELPADGRLFGVRCQWPAWEYIDPYKEAMGNKVALENRTKSISECIRERGGEPSEVFAEIAEDKKTLETLGVAPASGAEPVEENKETEEEK